MGDNTYYMALENWADTPDCIKTINGVEVSTIKCLEPLFINIVTAATALSGVALFLMLIIGGYNFLFAGGDQKKLEKAKGTLTGAIVGLIIIAVSYLIIKVISIITGVSDIETFNIQIQN